MSSAGKGLGEAEAYRAVDEPGEFARWYGASYAGLVRALTLMTRDVELASDVASEAFARAYARWDRVAQMESPTGWTYCVGVNLVRRHWRRQRMERLVSARATASTAMPAPEAVDPDLWRAVGRLPRRQREAVAFRYLADLTEAEIATVMRISEGAVSATLTRARRELAASLTDHVTEKTP
jgi:RNA polymerase sigma factor (sigma-70 family)